MCYDALSQMSANTQMSKLCSFVQHQSRNRVVMVLTGRSRTAANLFFSGTPLCHPAYQQAMAGQSFGISIIGLLNLFHQPQRLVWLTSRAQVRLRKAAPPRLIFEAHGPVGMRVDQSDQPVSGVFIAPIPDPGW